MELLEGESLATADKRPLPIREVSRSALRSPRPGARTARGSPIAT
jgi:hypothetical protein